MLDYSITRELLNMEKIVVTRKTIVLLLIGLAVIGVVGVDILSSNIKNLFFIS